MPNEKFTRRFTELADQMPPIRQATNISDYVPPAEYIGWATSASDLIHAVFGDNSPQHEYFSAALRTTTSGSAKVNTLRSIFISAKDAFERGYIFNVELTVSGELFGDLVGMAKHALSEGHKDVAAVLACAALEDALKRYARVKELVVDGKSMQDIVGALKSKGLVTGAQKSLLDSMPKIRDFAMHANWDKITAPDVNSIIGYVEQFLLTHFSGP